MLYKLNDVGYQVSTLAKFRCNVISLKIEGGLYRDSALKDRICQLYNNAVKD